MKSGLRLGVAIIALFVFCVVNADAGRRPTNGDWRKVYKGKRMKNKRRVHYSTHVKQCPRCSSGTIYGYRYVDKADVDYKWQYQKYNGRRRRGEDQGLPKWEYATTLTSSPTKIYWHTGCDNPDCSGEWAFLENRATYLLGGYDV